MIRLHLEKQELPIQDFDDLTGWENVEFSLLVLPDPQFEPILADALKKQKEKEDKLMDKRSISKEETYDNLETKEARNEAMQDAWIREMEKEFDRGNMDNLGQILSKYDSSSKTKKK